MASIPFPGLIKSAPILTLHSATEFNSNAKTSAMSYSGLPIDVAFAVAGGRVTGPARSAAVMSLSIVREETIILLDWASSIQRYVYGGSPPSTAVSRHKVEISVGAAKVEILIRMGALDIVQGELNRATGLLEYAARPAIDLAWSDFVAVLLWGTVHFINTIDLMYS